MNWNQFIETHSESFASYCHNLLSAQDLFERFGNDLLKIFPSRVAWQNSPVMYDLKMSIARLCFNEADFKIFCKADLNSGRKLSTMSTSEKLYVQKLRQDVAPLKRKVMYVLHKLEIELYG